MYFIVFDDKKKRKLFNRYPSYSNPYAPRGLFYRIGSFFKFVLAFAIFLTSLRFMYPTPFLNAYHFLMNTGTEIWTEISAVMNGTISYDQFAKDCFIFYLKHNIIGVLMELF